MTEVEFLKKQNEILLTYFQWLSQHCADPQTKQMGGVMWALLNLVNAARDLNKNLFVDDKWNDSNIRPPYSKAGNP